MPQKKTPVSECVRLIEESQKIAIIAPTHWNGDILTSMLALQSVIQSMKKEVFSFGPETKPFQFSYLNTDSILHSVPDKNNLIISLNTTQNRVKKLQYRTLDDCVEILIVPESGSLNETDISFRKGLFDIDLIITLGAHTKEDLGVFFEENTQLFQTTPVLNISTSSENEFFGTLNYVDIQKSSLGEMICDILLSHKETENLITPEIATFLLTGIIEQTESFLDSKTKSHTFHIASKLYNKGADHTDVINRLFKTKKFSTLRSWGDILETLNTDPIHKIAWSTLSHNTIQNYNGNRESIDEINQILLPYIRDIEISILFLETKNTTHISLQSQSPSLDTQKLNMFLGGKGISQKNGLMFIIENKKINDIHDQFLRLITEYQKQRHNIDKAIPLTPAVVEEKKVPTMPKNKTPEIPQPTTPKAPVSIPFEVLPAQKESSTDTQREKTEPIVQSLKTNKPSDTSNPTLPDWLR